MPPEPLNRFLPAPRLRARAAEAGRALLRTWPGRVLLAGAVVKAAVYASRAAGVSNVVLASANVLANLTLIVASLYFLVRLIGRARTRLLWRVRRKLIVSYIFIGVVPVLLIAAFFVLAGVLVFLNTGAYLARNALGRVTEEARLVADTIVAELPRPPGQGVTAATLSRWNEKLAARYPGASSALVPTGPQPCVGRLVQGSTASLPERGAAQPVPPGAAPATAAAAVPQGMSGPGPRPSLLAVGSWDHLPPPDVVPAWMSCNGFSGLVGVPFPASTGTEGDAYLVIRAVAFPPVQSPSHAVVVDVPVREELLGRLRAETTVKMGAVTLIVPDSETAPARPVASSSTAAAGAPQPAPGTELPRKRRISWVTILERIDWATGAPLQAVMTIEVSLRDIYDTLSPARLGSYTFGTLILFLLLLLAVLFLIIEAAALLMGLLLARSITGSIHELFAGTERVRAGDIAHRIRVSSDDQLGALAVSFNEMTSSITVLLREAEEKKRLEEELRIARTVQMSLLPPGDLTLPGLAVTAVCLPAREVGGDYFDFFRLEDGQLGLLIADVSGKGTSAAFYMAELKGLLLSLSRIHRSPRALLIEANRVISAHLDSRSFITMTYAVIDAAARTMVYARAGHTPLIHYRPGRAVRGNGNGVTILAPDGLVLGIKIDGGRMFEELLVEATLSLEDDDLLLFFTDGISEAMNNQEDCFGETRLGQLVAEHGHMPSDQLRERILREVDTFVDGAPQHDDMTMILVRIGGQGAGIRDRGSGIGDQG